MYYKKINGSIDFIFGFVVLREPIHKPIGLLSEEYFLDNSVLTENSESILMIQPIGKYFTNLLTNSRGALEQPDITFNKLEGWSAIKFNADLKDEVEPKNLYVYNNKGNIVDLSLSSMNMNPATTDNHFKPVFTEYDQDYITRELVGYLDEEGFIQPLNKFFKYDQDLNMFKALLDKNKLLIRDCWSFDKLHLYY